MITAGFTVILYALYLAGESAGGLTLYIAGIILTIPSVALFGAMIKALGIGPFNAAFALILYAQLPIMRNTYTGIKAVVSPSDPTTAEVVAWYSPVYPLEYIKVHFYISSNS